MLYLFFFSCFQDFAVHTLFGCFWTLQLHFIRLSLSNEASVTPNMFRALLGALFFHMQFYS